VLIKDLKDDIDFKVTRLERLHSETKRAINLFNHFKEELDKLVKAENAK